jgi:uncharacterized protein
MIQKKPKLWPLVLVFTVATSGCSSILAPRVDHSRFYVLAESPDESSSSASDPSGRQNLAVGVGPVNVPEYLQSRKIATRVGPNRMEYSDLDYWAEPLDQSVPRVLARDLSRSLRTDRVLLFPWNRRTHVDYQLEIDVQRFDIDPDNQAELGAQWSIKNPKTGEIFESGYTREIRAAGSDGASRTNALSAALGAFGDDLASRVNGIQERQSYESQERGKISSR